MIADHLQYWTIPLLIVTCFKCSFFDEYKCGYEVESYIYYCFVICVLDACRWIFQDKQREKDLSNHSSVPGDIHVSFFYSWSCFF